MILFALALFAADPAAAAAPAPGAPIQQMTVRCTRERVVGTNRTQRVCRSVRGIQLREEQDQARVMSNSSAGFGASMGTATSVPTGSAN